MWLHRRGPDGWEHAAGGDIELAPVVVGDDHTLRWAGPIRVRLAAMPGPLSAGEVTEIDLAVSGTSNQLHCSASWKLSSGTEIVASGNAGTCDRPEIALPATVVPGQYRLQIDAFAGRDDEYRLSDAVSIPITVIEPASTVGPR